ncbi:penicillin-binding protein 2 [Leptolyngbya sp. FACHB-261]|uniref:penicillin-binding protein 2 n=1 Tax=Leptolyngbya sp. FACHB-261 TaxID=2692806 RepID=UPI001682EE72|nr:penicillin-binding protein 2 [Leptolyngbya sp. FACHB-261]MBD2102884.1 penicillin-binding protein 2 [Leptolyngbya sp. FACHB-261]
MAISPLHSGFLKAPGSATNHATRTRQAIVLGVLTTLMTVGLGCRLAQLQLLEGTYNRELAEQNRVRPVPIPADRGRILDRKGRILAGNRLSRSVYLWPREESPAQWKQTAARLETLLKIPAAEILEKLKQTGYHSAMPVRISRDLSPRTFVLLSEQLAQFPGVEIWPESSRYYPNGDLAAHVLGYIGEATADDLKAHPEYRMGAIVGQMGIERIAEKQLQGVSGGRQVEVDARGQELRLLAIQAPVSGTSVQTTLDVDLQKAAEAALGKRRGGVVALDIKTGAILVLASGPTFDPNIFTRRISQAQWERLQGESQPFLNRALQGYPPGSTFKPVTAVAGIESGKYSPNSRVGTYAYINLGGHLFHEHGSSAGVIGFTQALAVSSNTFFYQVGLRTGPEEISKWSRKLGIGETEILGFTGGSRGQVPTPAEKEKLYGEPWYGGDTVSMSIGQGLVQVTPLELAVIYSAIANGGWRVKPHLLASQNNLPAIRPEQTGLSPSTISTIRSGLIAVVQRGTARRLNDGSIPLTAGKTGTAEVPGQKDNALYVGFGPVSNPQIAIAVVVENGGFGAVSAVPIAHEVYKAYFKNHRP